MLSRVLEKGKGCMLSPILSNDQGESFILEREKEMHTQSLIRWKGEEGSLTLEGQRMGCVLIF